MRPRPSACRSRPIFRKCSATEGARAKLKSAYFNIGLRQSADIGGPVTILSGTGLVKLPDFNQLEVRDGQLLWHRRPAERRLALEDARHLRQ